MNPALISFSHVRSIAGCVLLAASLGACVTTQPAPEATALRSSAAVSKNDAQRYAAIEDERFPIEAVAAGDLKKEYVRQVVPFPAAEPPGTIVVDPRRRFLYLVMENGKALRYGVGVGKAGLEFTGTANVGRKAEWPRWTPTSDMIRREPDRYAKWAEGMDGGSSNPLGPRALYLFKDGKDTLYRIHGTTEPWSIGQAVSSGCIRMLNQDVIDLYRRVPAGSKVVVR